MMLIVLDKNGPFVAEDCRVCQGRAATQAAERNPMTFVAIDTKHTEGTPEKKEKKINFSGNWEIRDLFDGIDSDLRLDMILNGRL